MEHNSVEPKIIIFHAAQCDPKKCTGLRLAKMRRATILKDQRRIPRATVVLNPISDIAFSPADRDSVLSAGIVALDCSWKQAEQILMRSISGNQRALPYLIAANPINTYKPIKLSTAEAIAAALYIIGEVGIAEDTLSVFKWGHSFITLNKEWLDAYASCASSTEVVQVQAEIMETHSR